MSKMYYSNFNDLFKSIKKDVADSLQKDVTNIVKETMSKHVKTDVYDTYKSNAVNKYERRGDSGGLSDIRNYKSEINNIDKNLTEIFIYNDTKGNSSDGYRDIIPVIEYGEGYQWESSEIYKMQPYPRPFNENTASELRENNVISDTVKKVLKSKGYDVK